jgi:ceramide glucosyltransferase
MGAILLLLLGLSGAGSAYAVLAASSVDRWARRAGDAAVPAEPVTVLKPLHGDEPRLADNLRSFVDQRWDAPVQHLAGVGRPDDGAVPTARALGLELVIDGTRHGTNAKIGNLINMGAHARHDLIVLSDSDMVAPPTYLSQVAAALARPGVGAVTCLYRGRGDAGPWSRVAAAGISYQFLPSVLVGLRLGLAKPCMGSTIALRRGTLRRIGGFERFADILADDYAIGAAVRAQGLAVAVPPMILVHGCTERSLPAIVRHELRWAATVRQIDLPGYLGMVVTHPLPFALAALMIAPLPGGIAVGAALLSRGWLKARVDRLVGQSTLPAWVLPARDLLSFGVFLLSFAVGSVEWRGSRFGMKRDGRMAELAR